MKGNESVLTIGAVKCTNMFKIVGRKAGSLTYGVYRCSRFDGHNGRLVVVGERKGIVVHN